MRASRIVVVIALAVGARAERAHAWEGLCRTTDDLRANKPLTRLDRLQRIEENVCAADQPDERPRRCEEGLGYARGAQLGEHAWLTREAMRAAGLPDGVITVDDLFVAPAGSHLPSGHFTAGQTVALAPALASLVPAGTIAMRTWVERRVAIAEVSEVADGSHSFSDYLLGNEHCLPANMARATRHDLEECHTFGNKMGVVNATHWPPLHREMYVRYHELAREVALRCAHMHAVATKAARHPLHADLVVRVQACEREALALQAYAAHFAQDAWSTGHMFIRWGGPVFDDDPEQQLRAFVATALTGFLHGTRSLMFDHDPASYPGPVVRGVLAPLVRWRDLLGGVHPGGGDLYLRPCTADEHSREGAVSTSAALRPQLAGLLACTVKGFQEVYALTGRAHGELAVRADPRVGPLPPMSTSETCFGARLTNASMYTAFAATRRNAIDIEPGSLTARADDRRRDEDFPTPGPFERFVLSVLIDGVPFLGSWSLTTEGEDRLGFERLTGAQRAAVERLANQIPDLRRELSQEAGRVALHLARRNRDAPDELDVATMTGPSTALREVFGVKSTYAWEGLLGGVPFLERPVARWAEPEGRACTTDDNCPGGSVCDRHATRHAGGTFTGRCMRHEHAILRAFRVAETPHWCRTTGEAELRPLRQTCHDAEPADRPRACTPCVEAALPHLVNPASFPGDTRSVCTVFEPTTAFAIAAERFTDLAGARRVVRAWCEAAPPPAPAPLPAPDEGDDCGCAPGDEGCELNCILRGLVDPGENE